MYGYEEGVYPGDYINPWFESKAYLMSDPEEDAPSSSEPAAPEESASGPEPSAPEESASDPGPSAPEPEAPEEETGVSVEETAEPEVPQEETEAPAEETVEPEPEAPPEETSSGVTGEAVGNLIIAIGDLNDTITEAAAQDSEESSAKREEEPAIDFPEYEYPAAASSDVDLEPVIQVLERQEEVLNMLHNDLLQLQANVDFVFLAVVVLIGVVLGVAVGQVLYRIWRF